MPKINRTNSKGLVQETGIGSIGLPFTESVELIANAAETTFVSSEGLVQPAGSFIKSITIVCTTTHAAAAGNIGFRVGTAAGGAQVVDLDADSLVANNAAFAAGKGSSTRGEIKTALQGAANLEVVAGQSYTATKRTLFPEVVAAGGNITAGKYKCTIEFAS